MSSTVSYGNDKPRGSPGIALDLLSSFLRVCPTGRPLPSAVQAVACGNFDGRGLSFGSSSSRSSDNMNRFAHNRGDGRHVFSRYHHVYSDSDAEDEEGSEENFFEPDPSEPTDCGLPCLSRRFFVG